MSLLLLIDGYNVVAPIAAPHRSAGTDWLQRERMLLIDRLVTHLPADVRRRTCIVFDAADPPPDRPSEFDIHGIAVRFAVDYAEADDLLEEIIAEHSAPKQLAVVSSDHRVQAAATRRGAQVFDSQPWLDRLLEGRTQLAIKIARAGQGSAESSDKPTSAMDDDEVNRWMREFGLDD